MKIEIQKAYAEKMPYISRSKVININSIQIPDNQYVMKNIFNDIINLFVKDISFPGENKCGLAYIFEQEWIYFTLGELPYQKYISDANRQLSLIYEEFMNKKLNPDNLSIENDKNISPTSIKGFDFEKNVTKYFQNKIKLEESPDLLIKLGPIEKVNNDNNNIFNINNSINNNHSKNINFDGYFKLIKYNYIEIDGAFINDTKKEIIIENKDKALIPYSEINVFQIKNKDNTLSFISEIDKSGKFNNTIRIKDKTVVFFQTKLQCPFIQLNSKSVTGFNNDFLPFDDMKKELAVVLNKMIIYGKKFLELYKKIGLIKDDYSVLLFLIFDNYPIRDISEKIKLYLDILIQKEKITYPFTIRPIYMISSIDLINHQINSDDFNKKIEDMEKRREEDLNKIKEMEKNREEDLKRREEDLNIIKEMEKNREEDLKRREEDSNKIKEMEKKINALINNQTITNQNSLNMEKCDEKALESAKRIREKIEKEFEFKFKLFEPVGFKYELKDNKEYYAFKVYKGDQKYIHVFASGEKDNIDKMEINISIGKDWFDQL